MAPDSLFDKGRRAKLRDAMRTGKLGDELKQRLPEPDLDVAATRVFGGASRGDDKSADQSPASLASIRHKMHQSQVFAVGRDNHVRKVDQDLFDAIKAGNLQKLLDAISQGADVNAEYTHVPAHKVMDTIFTARMTPLQYAKEKGNQAIIDALERHGAKD
ncbi:hypothetical protein L0Y65_06135 [Candidatus Micrarchaeota archaeon]|nr:hypothetical protein [Candidatus Micrarchaeota archaeon]